MQIIWILQNMIWQTKKNLLLQQQLNEATEVRDNKEATQEDVDYAAAKLARIMSSLPTADGNLAYGAAVSTSYVSSWEKLSAVNDGEVLENHLIRV